MGRFFSGKCGRVVFLRKAAAPDESGAAASVWGMLPKGLEFGVVGSAGEGDDVTDVGHAGHEEYETLEAEAESRVGN